MPRKARAIRFPMQALHRHVQVACEKASNILLASNTVLAGNNRLYRYRPGLVPCYLSRDRASGVATILLPGRGQHEVVAHRVIGYLHLHSTGRQARLVALKRRDQVSLYGENSIRVKIWIARLKNVCNQRLVARSLDHKVNVRRAHWTAISGV